VTQSTSSTTSLPQSSPVSAVISMCNILHLPTRDDKANFGLGYGLNRLVSFNISSGKVMVLPHHSTVTIALTYDPGAILPIKVKGRRCSRAYCYQ